MFSKQQKKIVEKRETQRLVEKHDQKIFQRKLKNAGDRRKRELSKIWQNKRKFQENLKKDVCRTKKLLEVQEKVLEEQKNIQEKQKKLSNNNLQKR